MDDLTAGLLRSAVASHAAVYGQRLPAEAELVELGVMASHPGAPRQVAHSDVTYVEGAQEVFTTFVALQVSPFVPLMTVSELTTCIWK